MAKAFKKKKLPKYRFGDSVYEDTEPSVTSNPTLLNTGGTEFTSTGSSNFYNNKVYNSTDIVPQQQPTSNNRANMSMYGNIAQSAASGLTNRQNARYTDSQSDSTNASLEEAGGKALPWLGMATSLRNMGQSMLQRDEAGNIKGGGSKMANEWMTADHTHMLREAKKGNAAGVLRESSSMGKIGRSISQLANKDEETTGNWGKFNKIAGVEKKKELVDPNKEYEEQMKRQDMMNKLSSGTFRQGGIFYPTNAIPIHGGNWAIPTFSNGGRMYNPNIGEPNAEIEKEEVTSYTQGGIEAHNLNTHENATPDNQINLQRGDMILSDKLKDPLNKNKTFAKVGKPYDTAKEEKVLSDIKASTLSKKTAELNFMTKKSLFQQTFERQKQLKVDKVRKYANKLGVDLNVPQQSNLGIIPEFNYGGRSGDPPSNYASWRSEKEKLGWQPSPLSDPKSPQQDMYDPTAFRFTKVEDPNTLGVNDHVWEGYDKTKYKYEALKPNALDAFGYKNADYYSNFTPPTKKISTSSSFMTGYTPAGDTANPSHYIKINDPSKTRYQYIKGSYVPVHKYGGIQKFGGGGKKSLVFKPKPITEDAGVEYPSVPNSIYQEPYNSQDVIDPRFRTKPGLNDTEAELLVKSAQEQSKKYEAEQLAKEQGSPKYNWKDTAYQVGTGLASNMGEILALHKASKPVEVQKMYEYSPEKLDFIPTERSYRAKRRMVLENVKNLAGGSSGTALSNIAAQNAALTEQEDSARREFANINAGIGNQAKQFNIGNRYATDDINARNRAAKQNLQLKATERMGSNIAQQAKDYRMSEQDKEMLPFLQQAFSDPSFKAMLAQWAKTKGYSK